MPSPFRIGIVGTGLIVQESHLPACLAARDVAVSALVDAAPGRADECARRFGLAARVLSDASELAGLVDGVIIATPDDSHAEIAERCLQARLPVLIEKPLAPTDEECERIREAARRHATTVAVGYCLRFWPSVDLVANLLRSGALGTPRRYVMQVGSPGGWAPLSAYYLRRQGGGAMSINGSHYLERALHWFGTATEVSYEDDSAGGPEANAMATLRHGDVTGVVRVSRTTKLNAGSAIETDRGTLVHRDFQAPVVEFIPHGDPSAAFVSSRKDVTVSGRPDAYRLQVEDFARSVRTGQPPRVGADHGAAVTRLINDLYRCKRRMDDRWYSPGPSMGASP
jgi:predicted dehydrogenase